MQLEFENEYDPKYDEYEKIYLSLMKKTFKHLKIKADYEVDVSLINNERIHEINKEYRHIDRPTDVISFAFLDEVEGEVKIKGNIPTLLGEIFISVDKALEQAKSYGHSIKREMCFLFVHGLLHLLGYDHMKKEDEVVMFSLQEEILKGEVFMTNEELIELAKEARKLAYTPYSHFKVGAVVVTKDGKHFFGANIENASYPLCMCAERNALYHTYMNGYKKDDIAILALVADTEDVCSPCGACRQVISELFPREGKIVMGNLKGKIKETSVKELLPFAFDSSDL